MQKKRTTCLVKDCGKATHGRQYCSKHLDIKQRRTLPTDMVAFIRSACCDASCQTGKPHDLGEQYCAKCKEPCLWRPA